MKKIILYYFICLTSIFMFLSSGVIDSQDGFQYVEVARNIYYKGEPTGPIYKYDTRENIFMSSYVGKDGKTYSHTGLGYSVALVPAVALSDIVYKIYNVSPPVNFPLESDWLIFLTTSFTNSFFGALLGIVLFLYLLEMGLTKKQSFFLSLAGMFSTNLLVYTKNSFAHMMFVSLLFLAFYLVKEYFKTSRLRFLIFAGVSYGITAITYNQTFILSVVPLIVYFLFLSKLKLTFQLKKIIPQIKSFFPQLLFFSLGFLPFLIIYIWFENLRVIQNHNLANPAVVLSKGLVPILNVPVGVFIEGFYGQLFSPGRSIFIYSPVLLLIIIFWHKIKRVIFPELAVFLTFSVIYILFYSTQFSYGSVDQGIAGLWHGESSWGPRYLLPLIPFGLLIVGFIYKELKKMQKLLIFLPLLMIGFYVELLGVLMPYQIKYHELQDKFFVNSTEFTNFAYSNLLPRFSPIFMMSKKLVKLGQSLPSTLNHGEYNVRFYDGIDFPFPVGFERWRVIDKKGYISFDNLENAPVRKVSLDLINHPIDEASYSATVKASINNNLLRQVEFLPEERKTLNLEIPQNLLQNSNNQLVIDVEFKSLKDGTSLSDLTSYKDDPSQYTNKTVQPKKSVSQILSIINLSINEKTVNKESLETPYVSSLGPPMTGKPYQNYGALNPDPWKTWEIHTQIYERVPDFWWFKFLYYWDVPKLPISLLFVFIVGVMIFSGYKTVKLIGKK